MSNYFLGDFYDQCSVTLFTIRRIKRETSRRRSFGLPVLLLLLLVLVVYYTLISKKKRKKEKKKKRMKGAFIVSEIGEMKVVSCPETSSSCPAAGGGSPQDTFRHLIV